MQYRCTRGGETLSAAQAILRGLSEKGGLYVKPELDRAPLDMLPFDAKMPYDERAQRVLALFFDDFSESELREMTKSAYRRFDTPEVAPVKKLSDDTYVLELFHGPTLAFKDMALQLLPYLTVAAARKCGEKRTISILTATSGDTGKAALEGFMDVPGTRCTVFYPRGGVSLLQERQMLTAGGDNTQVVSVTGNFDDAQTGVKKLFNDPAFIRAMDEKGCVLSSANSINIGRLVPQVAYYFSAYADLCAAGALKTGEAFDVCVPTGNFGDILSAWYARRMGVPIARLICASNQNDVLTDFIKTGVYDARRPFHKTISPSMDILISSNLERLLYELCDGDTEQLCSMMASLKENGYFTLAPQALARLQQAFVGVMADDDETRAQILSTWTERHYLIDPHTAVAMRALNKLRRQEGNARKTLVVSTASPFKFAQDVGEAMGIHRTVDALKDAQRLADFAGCPLPKPLDALRGLPYRHDMVCTPAEMGQAVLSARDLNR